MSGDDLAGAVWLANLAGLLGAVLLALPVLRLDRLAKRLADLEQLAPGPDDDPRWQRLSAGAEQDVRRVKDRWSPMTRVCLWLGYGLVLGSQAARLWMTG